MEPGPVSGHQVRSVGLFSVKVTVLTLCFSCLSLCHTATVKQLSWKPRDTTEDGQSETVGVLASCSHDNSVKLFRIRLCTD